MKTKLILIIVFVLTEWCAHAQLTFQKTYKGIGVNGSQSISHTFDNGFIIAGLTQYFDTIEMDNSLCKLDSLGNVEWNTVIGDTLNEQCYSVQQTYDGGYIVAGTTQSFGTGSPSAFYFKADASGNILWAKIMDGTVIGYYGLHSVKQTSDNGFIFGGITTGLEPLMTICTS